MKTILILSIVILSSCNLEHPGEPVVTGVELSGNEKVGKYYVTVKMGMTKETFWSNYEYKIGDTLKVCK